MAVFVAALSPIAVKPCAADVSLTIVSRAECVFGDADLILRDLVRDHVFNYRDSVLMLEVFNEKTRTVEYSQRLVDLANEDREQDPFAAVFADGLGLKLPVIKDGTYGVSICKVAAEGAGGCRVVPTSSFDAMMKIHAEDSADTTRYDRLYFHRRFQVNNGVVSTEGLPKDNRDLVNSLPLEVSNRGLVLNLPRADEAKCALP